MARLAEKTLLVGTRVEEKAAKPVEVRTRQGNRYLEGPSKVCQAEKTSSITQFVGNCPSRYVQGGRSKRAGTRIDATGAWMIAVHDNTTVPCSILVKSRAFDRPKVLGRGGLPSGRMSAGVKHGTSLRHSARNSKGMDGSLPFPGRFCLHRASEDHKQWFYSTIYYRCRGNSGPWFVCRLLPTYQRPLRALDMFAWEKN